MQLIQCAGFADTTDLILDAVRETGVEMVTESAFTIAPDLGHKLIEVNHIFVDAVVVLHVEIIQLIFSISNQVMGAEGGLEFYNKLLPVIHP